MSDQTNNDNGSGSSKTLIIIAAVVAVVVIAVLAFMIFGNQNSAPDDPTPVPPAADVPTPLPDSPSLTANVDINVRSGPGTNYPAYGVAAAGSQAAVIGVSVDGGWWNITVKPENIPAGNAWVSGEYVTAENTDGLPVVEAPPPPPEAVPPTPEPGAPTATTLDVVNVRTGPGLEYPIYGLAPKGASGLVVGISEDSAWWAVELSTTISPVGMGWVSADWVTTENTENVPVVPAGELPPPAEVPPPAEGEPQATSIEPINVRSGPGSSYETYGVVPIGTTGRVIGISEDGGWWVVAVSPAVAPDGMGWVSAAYVTTANTEGVPVIETPPLP